MSTQQSQPSAPADQAAPAGTAIATARPPLRILNSLMWALLLPLAAVAAGFLSQYPFGLFYLGIAVTLVVVATTGIIAGAGWSRPVAATLAAVSVFTLPFLAGPTTYELYAKRLGHTVSARITPGTHCHVLDADGVSEELTQRQNCVGQFAPGQRVVLFRDPFGVLHPWAEANGSRAVPSGTLAATGVLFAVSTALILYAGLCRRAEAASAA
ncbi:hypothetical protein [Streptomyces montanisoli]|uniref:Uncharacterized protein n=1 Tax=Streptomyces montanisoli TaxID=2798581 RepID=A0A940MB83_9ACTN|nr:hypothetical protein [Streptomyces montanisoli]MBP0459735.1 hypothetical protein [Streptomyces montanisoli]